MHCMTIILAAMWERASTVYQQATTACDTSTNRVGKSTDRVGKSTNRVGKSTNRLDRCNSIGKSTNKCSKSIQLQTWFKHSSSSRRLPRHAWGLGQATMESELAAETQWPSRGIMLAPPVQLALGGQGESHLGFLGWKEYWEAGQSRHCLGSRCTQPLLHGVDLMGMLWLSTCRAKLSCCHCQRQGSL